MCVQSGFPARVNAVIGEGATLAAARRFAIGIATAGAWHGGVPGSRAT